MLNQKVLPGTIVKLPPILLLIIKQEMQNKPSIPKIRISLRKQATIQIGDSHDNKSICQSIEEVSNMSSRYSTRSQPADNLITRYRSKSCPNTTISIDFTNSEDCVATNLLKQNSDKDKSSISGKKSSNILQISTPDVGDLKQGNILNKTSVVSFPLEKMKPQWDTEILCLDNTEKSTSDTKQQDDQEGLKEYKLIESPTDLKEIDESRKEQLKLHQTPCSTNKDVVSPAETDRKNIKKKEVTPSVTSLSAVKLLTRSKTRTPEKFGINQSRDNLFKSLPEASPRKRKQVDMNILKDLRLTKHACALWFSECRRQFQQRHPKASSQQLDELMRLAWDRLTPRHRLPYFVRAKSVVEEKYQDKKIKVHNTKSTATKLLTECSPQQFLAQNVSEQNTYLKQSLYDIQSHLSAEHYETFLGTVMLRLAKSATGKGQDKHEMNIARIQLYEAISEMQEELATLEREAQFTEKIEYLQELYESIDKTICATTTPRRSNLARHQEFCSTSDSLVAPCSAQESKESTTESHMNAFVDGLPSSDIGGSGDVKNIDIRGSPTYKDIFNYLKYGSCSGGILSIAISGEDWIIPNVANRLKYKSILLEAISHDLPVLDSTLVSNFLEII